MGGRTVTNLQQNDFEREKVCYEQNFEQARSLNAQMNQIPTLAITLTGGLWFAAGITEKMQTPTRFGLLVFAGVCNIGLVLAILRVRDVFNSYLEKLRIFHEPSFVDGRSANPRMGRLGAYSMVTVYSLLMFVASALSFLGAFAFYWPFDAKMVPFGIGVVVGSAATFFTFLYSNWKRTALVALLSAVILTAIALWMRCFRGY